MTNVNYAFVKDGEGDLTFESKVTSFGINHVTKKDLKSFYVNFSSKAYFDTGLIPVDGSGLLSIRTAGNHTQIAYQHKPGLYYINWGRYERDPNAAKIYVAQPYRIVIADIYNGNILGARTFYSPIPIQHPATPLYHVNLPNINCRGYRGNGVGWICLYHTEDISTYPFSEKLAKILERCSGVEAYNDANMSETDGPRFYKDHGKPSFLWDPQEWEVYSEKHDFTWTLDPDLWIPVLVADRDNQEEHAPTGVPLTFADAILGNYQAYYTDPIRPKLVNKISREDLDITNNDIFDLFKISYNSSLDYGMNFTKKNTMDSSIKVRENLSQIFVAPPTDVDHEHDPEDFVQCDGCGEDIDIDSDEYVSSYHSETFCESCCEDLLVWIEHLENYVRSNNDYVQYLEWSSEYYYTKVWEEHKSCSTCGMSHLYDTASEYPISMIPIWPARLIADDQNDVVCKNCIGTTDKYNCAVCNCAIPNPDIYDVHSLSSAKTKFQNSHVCNTCFYDETLSIERTGVLTPQSTAYCLCGNKTPILDFTPLMSGSTPITAFKNFGFGSANSVIGQILQNMPYYASNFESFKGNLNKNSDFANVAFSVSIRTNSVCPECALSAVGGHDPDYHKNYSSVCEENLLKFIEEFGNLDSLYGTAVRIYSTF